MKKTIMVHIDGMSAHSFEELGTRTILQAANIPHFDHLAQHGELGHLGIPHESRAFAGELAFLGLLGYETQKWYGGPGAFEAMNLEVVLDRNDVAFLCDFVTLRAEDGWGDGKKLGPALVMDDVSGGELETEEARELIDAINEQLVSENIQFYFGHHARHLMVWVGGNVKIGCRNPQEALGQSIEPYLPTGEGTQILREFMEASRMILRHHSVNQERVNAGLKPANCLWPWGQSKPVELTPLIERWPIEGTVVSQSGPYRGVALASGLKVVKSEDLEESQPEPLGQMAKLASMILEKQDLACLHIPFFSLFPSHRLSEQAGMVVEYLEKIDEYLVKSLQQFCSENGNTQLFVVITPGAGNSKEGSSSPAPFVLYEEQKADKPISEIAFHEHAASQGPIQRAGNFFDRFFGGK